MYQKTFSVLSRADGLSLSALYTMPETVPPKCVLQIAHGMSEYKERYLPMCEAMSQSGIACLIHDHRGHGKSPFPDKPLGYFGKDGAAALADDVAAVWDAVQPEFPHVPRVLMGHSMGSLIARECVKTCDTQLAGLILSGSPSRNDLVRFGKALCAMLTLFKGEAGHSRLLDFMAVGTFNLSVRHPRTMFDWLNIDSAEVDLYVNDPMCGFPFTISGYRALFDCMTNAYAPCRANSPSLPILFLSGGDDPCRISDEKLDEAIRAMRDRGYRDVDTVIYRGQRHEILRASVKDKVFSDITAWISANL